jgi:structural maintenance of chromosome 1
VKNEVQAIASKSPKELTSLFERISGSEELRAEYDNLKVSKDKAEKKALDEWKSRQQIAMEKKQFKEQQKEVESYKKMQTDLVGLGHRFD